MTRGLLVLLCFFAATACASGTYNVETKSEITIEMAKGDYQFGDYGVAYAITNNADNTVDCSSYGVLEKKNGDTWVGVPSTIPDPVAWCGTRSVLNPGETKKTLSFLSYNGTLAAGTYRIAIYYSLREANESGTAYSKGFTLTGEFPLSAGYPIPADVHLEFDADVFPKALRRLPIKS